LGLFSWFCLLFCLSLLVFAVRCRGVVPSKGGLTAHAASPPVGEFLVAVSAVLLLLLLLVAVVICGSATGERQPQGQRSKEEREFDFHRVV